MSPQPKPLASLARRALSAFLGLTTAAAIATTGAMANSWPSRVDATFKIAFNGFDVGKFEFRAEVTGTSYSVQGDARLSALLGAFKWHGATRSSGQLSGATPRPAGYTFDYRGIGRDGSIKVGFQQGAVTSISSLPVKPPVPGTVPLGEQHLKSVLDPLSAVLALSRTGNANPCGRKLAIFDGKQRFDLALTFVRQQAIAETRPSGQPGVAFVCRVRYQPIAGHLPNAETRHMATTDGIELSLRPVPSAGLFVPYQISIPTAAGSVTLTSERVDIVSQGEQIALTH
jgi:hypothetical protein